ncbi:NAD(P)/FAD-dependent oxidoreductase [Knoellia sp. CPCC 206435]|uniref:NAD(P)/FAD-dependent oxidoreductase n=1 Tax=Knoellia terrae TaxID=3404797 RepID=UPI003B42D0FB
MFDVVVIGAGPAGLQAAQTLGRMHRPTLLLDSGSYRNAPVDAVHNVLTADGRPPARLRELARQELRAYRDVQVSDTAALVVDRHGGDGFSVRLADGSSAPTRAVLLATGLRDLLPDVPGMAEQWGRTVFMCPFCHGHELHGRRVVVEENPAARDLVAMFEPIARSVDVVPTVTALAKRPDGLHVSSGRSTVVVDGLFVHVEAEQAAPFAAQLGLEMRDTGCIAVDSHGRTSVPGIFAAGDLAQADDMTAPVHSVLAAAYAGQLAATSALQHVLHRRDVRVTS